MAEDIADGNARVGEIDTRLETEADSEAIAGLTAERAAIVERVGVLGTDRAAFEQVIADITAKVTETGAIALTIEATIADEEAQIAEDEALWAFDDLLTQQEILAGEILETEFYADLTADPLEAARYDTALAELYEQRSELAESLQDQENALAQIAN